MAKYTMREMSDKLTGTKSIRYPKMVHMGQVDTDMVARMVSEYTGSSAADVKGVLEAVSFIAARQMSMGYSVRLRGIGTLSPRLGMKPGIDREDPYEGTKRNATGIQVCGINFRADKTLIEETQAHTRLERSTTTTHTAIVSTPDERLRLAVDYIKEKGVLHIREYASLTGLERTAAGRELLHFATEGHLIRHGRATHIYYTI